MGRAHFHDNHLSRPNKHRLSTPSSVKCGQFSVVRSVLATEEGYTAAIEGPVTESAAVER